MATASTQRLRFEETSQDLPSLVGTALDLGAAEVGGPLAPAERRLVRRASRAARTPARRLRELRAAIAGGSDPLGDLLVALRPAEERKSLGAFFTPPEIVRPMVRWLAAESPDRVVDAGCGSGRFAAETWRQIPAAAILAIDIDPVCTLLTRGHLAAMGTQRARVLHGDFVRSDLEPAGGRTAFVGNPPYVRHHQLTPEQKRHAQRMAEALGIRLSQLAGLHAHFYVATARHARPGDVGCYVVSAEWLDVNYGDVIRRILTERLPLEGIEIIDPRALPFPDVMTTACVTYFRAGEFTPQVSVYTSVKPTPARTVPADALRQASRWGSLLRNGPGPSGHPRARLGDFFRVSRGVVTGANAYFVMSQETARSRGLDAYTRPVLTAAEEVLSSEGVVEFDASRDVLLDPPPGIDLAAPEHSSLRAYVQEGERRGICDRYVCRHRRPWWRIGHGEPPPIVATYMARQPPRFALNPDRLALVNVLHGLYPRIPPSEGDLGRVVGYLNAHRQEFVGLGRTYQGGLEKFEPGEMESLPVPPLDAI